MLEPPLAVRFEVRKEGGRGATEGRDMVTGAQTVKLPIYPGLGPRQCGPNDTHLPQLAQGLPLHNCWFPPFVPLIHTLPAGSAFTEYVFELLLYV